MMQLPLSQKSRDLVGLLRVHHHPASLLSFSLDAVSSDISMRNIFLFWGALLLVDGVFGVDVTLTVMEGDSLTLKPQTEIPEGEDDSAQWWFGDLIIAKIKKSDGIFSTSKGDDVGFKGRLKLDNQTGSLTITNTRTNDSGIYKLKIKRRTGTPDQIFSVTVSDVVKSLSVTEGDNVTLHTGVDIQRDDQILWKFGDQVLNGPDDTRWRNIRRNDENGEITIRNIQTDQSGDYELEINTASMILHRKLNITISGEMKPVSVKKGESIILDTRLIRAKGYDLILWKFKDQLIAELNKGTDKFSTNDTRLQLGQTMVSLIISDSRITDTGDYSLHMISSSHTVQRNISVTVKVSDKQTPDKQTPDKQTPDKQTPDKQTPDPGLSPGAVAGIVVVLLLVFAAAVAGVIYRRRKISELQRQSDDAKKNGTKERLKDGTANSDDL